jgi:hypothetical protein
VHADRIGMDQFVDLQEVIAYRSPVDANHDRLRKQVC